MRNLRPPFNESGVTAEDEIDVFAAGPTEIHFFPAFFKHDFPDSMIFPERRDKKKYSGVMMRMEFSGSPLP